MTRIQHTRNKFAKIYAAGMLTCVVFFGSVTQRVRILACVNMG